MSPDRLDSMPKELRSCWDKDLQITNRTRNKNLDRVYCLSKLIIGAGPDRTIISQKLPADPLIVDRHNIHFEHHESGAIQNVIYDDTPGLHVAHWPDRPV